MYWHSYKIDAQTVCLFIMTESWWR